MFDQLSAKIIQNKHNLTIIVTVVTIVWIIMVIGLGLYPSIKDAFNASDLINQAQTINSSLDSKIVALNSARNTYKQEAVNTDLVKLALPSDPKIITFMNAVASLATNNKLNLSKFDYQGIEDNLVKSQDTQPGEKTSLTFDVIGRGDYFSIEAFIIQLESLPRVTSVNSITINRDKKDETQVADGIDNPLIVTLQGEFYYK